MLLFIAFYFNIWSLAVAIASFPVYLFFYETYKNKAVQGLKEDLKEQERIKNFEIDKNISLLDGYKKAVDESNIVSKTDTKGIITYVNEQFIKISGYTREELIGKPHNVIRHPEMPKEVFSDLWHTIKAKHIWKGIVKNRRKDGSDYIVNSTIVPIMDNQGDIIEFIGIRHNITDLIETERKLEEQRINPLTGLLNRYALIGDLKELKSEPALAILDIDSFEEINDFYGTNIGDEILKNLADKIKSSFHQEYFIIYKLPIDQYAVLLKDVNFGESEFLNRVKQFVNNINSTVLNCKENEIFINLTFGFASKESVYQHADMALNQAKRQMKTYHIYTNEDLELTKTYESNITWTKKLKKAINNNKIVSFYQPIVDNKTQKIYKYESLVRMIDDDGKIISPFFFLDISKKAKLYPKITYVVFNSMVEMLKDYPHLECSMNLTADDIDNKTMMDLIKSTLMRESISNRVILEITESEEIKNYKKMLDVTKEFKEMGCKIAIDDFGSGYSNFNYLMDIEADFIKIDGSLIKNIDKDKNSLAIVESIVSFAKKMNIKTVAEFVSSKEIYERVNEIGVDFSQGYYFSEPLAEPKKD